MVTGGGRICFRGRTVNLSHVFAGQSVCVTQVGERIWLVTFMQYDLGYFDDETCRLRDAVSHLCHTTAVRPPGQSAVIFDGCQLHM
jgi:putative transposase